MITVAHKARPGTGVVVNNGFFEGRPGKIHEDQEDMTKNAGVWVSIKATDNGPERRLWFDLRDLDILVH